jgi:hypothetical protein
VNRGDRSESLYEQRIDPFKIAQEWPHFAGFGWNVSQFAQHLGIRPGSLIHAMRKADPRLSTPILAAWQREIETRGES